MRSIPIVLAGMALACAALVQGALAQEAPPPAPPTAAVGAPPPPPGALPPPAGPFAAAEPAPPPPPGGPRGDRPPPPPPGAAVIIDRGPNGMVHVDVHCARADTTKDCADIASRLFAQTGVAPGAK